MSQTAKEVKNKSLIAAIVIDLLLLLLSALVDKFISGTLLLRIVLFCYCIRFELMVALVILVLLYLFPRFVKNAKKVHPALYSIMMLLILLAAGFTIKPAKQLFFARRLYFQRQYFKDETQKRFLDNAMYQISKNEWDLCLQKLYNAKMLYPQSRYTYRINKAMDEAVFNMEYGERLHDTYVKSLSTPIALNTFKCAKTLYGIYPSKYEEEYSILSNSVVSAIKSYPQLYDAVDANDYEKSRELILQYGWCWFEPTVYEKLSLDNEAKVMEWLNQYLKTEDPRSGENRMIRNWFEEEPRPFNLYDN